MKTMKTIFGNALAMALFIGGAAFMVQYPTSESAVKPQEGNGFAVVELFTSEGCSSCPPADALLQQLQEQDAYGQLYILAFHVDYWDHQGWKDRFSDHAYSLRQRKYADWLGVPTVYTPQLVVNGESEHIGSDGRAVSAAINQALQQSAARQLQLEAKINRRQLTVTPNLKPAAGSGLLVALVQRQAESRVKAGENEGRRLAHVQIVRDLKVATGKEVKFTLPEGADPRQYEVVGFVQNYGTGKITDAARCRWE